MSYSLILERYWALELLQCSCDTGNVEDTVYYQKKNKNILAEDFFAVQEGNVS